MDVSSCLHYFIPKKECPLIIIWYCFFLLSVKFWLLLCFTFVSDSHTAGLVKFRGPYPFGVDPSWRGSRSELPFLNSLKMKMSILLGVAQMNLGIILSYFNARFFNNSLDIRSPPPSPSYCLALWFVHCVSGANEPLFILGFVLLGINFYHRWYFSTAFLAICRS